jgi:DNA-binding NarL/FixJ family response regulator
MSASLPLIRQLFHITLDIEAMVDPETNTTLHKQAEPSHRVLVQALLAHPEILHQLLRSAAIAELRMSGINGIEATRRILTEHPQVHILVLTMFDDDASVFAAWSLLPGLFSRWELSHGLLLRRRRRTPSF